MLQTLLNHVARVFFNNSRLRISTSTSQRITRIYMTSEQEQQCHVVIHTSAVLAAAGNAVPVPGLGIAADVTAMTGMAAALATVFGGSIAAEVAKAMAIAAIRETILKQPIKVLTKELSKLVPILGQIVAPAISLGMLEAAGWALAREMDNKFSN